MAYFEHRPPPGLRPAVECAWTVRTTETETEMAVRPDGCLDLIYSRTGGLRAVGAMTREMRYQAAAGTVTAGVRFRPGHAADFLRVAASDLTDRTVALEDLLGREARELRRRLDDSPGDWALTILGSLRVPDEAPNGAQLAIDAIARARGAVDTRRAASEANLSARQFRRRCLERSGLSPKHLSRVLRFRYALEAAQAIGRPDWAGLAAEFGYYDQAHLIRDFREFTGRTPMAVISNTERAEAA